MNVDHNGTLYSGEDKNKPYHKAAARDFPGFCPQDIMTVAERCDFIQKDVARLEAKLDRLLELFEPRVIDKPAEMTGARSIGKAKVTP